MRAYVSQRDGMEPATICVLASGTIKRPRQEHLAPRAVATRTRLSGGRFGVLDGEGVLLAQSRPSWLSSAWWCFGRAFLRVSRSPLRQGRDDEICRPT